MPELMWSPADAIPAAGPELAPASPVSSDSADSGAKWHEAWAMFANDPRSATELAAALVEDSVELLVVSVRERQRSLLSAWQGDDTGPEDMWTAVQHHRAFWSRLEDFSHEI
jgi:hypothetical protein